MFIEVGQEGDPCQERFGHVRTNLYRSFIFTGKSRVSTTVA